MILGFGKDRCDVQRIADALERQGQRFRNRICSDREQQLALERAEPAPFYAGRFAAKEACAKALGTGITERVRWTNIEVLADAAGRPVLDLSEGALRRTKRLAAGRNVRWHVSISYEGGVALAFVIVEAD